jgi:hypothetical protein
VTFMTSVPQGSIRPRTGYHPTLSRGDRYGLSAQSQENVCRLQG